MGATLRFIGVLFMLVLVAVVAHLVARLQEHQRLEALADQAREFRVCADQIGLAALDRARRENNFLIDSIIQSDNIRENQITIQDPEAVYKAYIELIIFVNDKFNEKLFECLDKAKTLSDSAENPKYKNVISTVFSSDKITVDFLQNVVLGFVFLIMGIAAEALIFRK